ncbi:hypothetical protein MKK75_26555 [Methylobacterium sp. J-030]|uniref:hypothetical protein n=1 Tax=Methylobacterium sp. J-030 TaxID=2836627 RepID=UPI001FBA36EA|nr:hypothetical protein [Methylobacterium sp. J-030]MCJ2072311.1 hypothetical protein [Methylobacterium sp. J-030]
MTAVALYLHFSDPKKAAAVRIGLEADGTKIPVIAVKLPNEDHAKSEQTRDAVLNAQPDIKVTLDHREMSITSGYMSAFGSSITISLTIEIEGDGLLDILQLSNRLGVAGHICSLESHSNFTFGEN